MSDVVIRRPGLDFFIMDDHVAESGRRMLGARGGIPSAGDLVMLPDPDGRPRRWEIRAVGFPLREHHPDMQDVWTAALSPAPVALRVVA
jgi:hypothetical protein